LIKNIDNNIDHSATISGHFLFVHRKTTPFGQGSKKKLARFGQPRKAPSMHPSMKCTKGLWIPLTRRHNYMNFMQMVGPPGLEPGTKGLTPTNTLLLPQKEEES